MKNIEAPQTPADKNTASKTRAGQSSVPQQVKKNSPHLHQERVGKTSAKRHRRPQFLLFLLLFIGIFAALLVFDTYYKKTPGLMPDPDVTTRRRDKLL